MSHAGGAGSRSGWWIVRATLLRARGRALWSLASLALIGALVSSLLGIDASVGDRARAELARFGPNVFIVPADAGAADFPAQWLPDGRRLAALGVETAVAVRLEHRSDAEGHAEILAGVTAIDPTTGVPSWAMPGADPKLLADADRLVAMENLGRMGAPVFHSVALRVRPDSLDGLVDAIAREAPGLSARVVRSVAFTESRVLQRTGAFVLGAAIILLALAGLCFSSTLMAQWMERRAEVGLMLALGGTRRRIARLFAREVAALALIGGIGGGACGSLIGWWILRHGFGWDGSLATWPWWTLVAALAATAIVAAAGSVLPSWSALRAEPVSALRGE